MQIVVAATEAQWKELAVPADDASLLHVTEPAAFASHPDAGALINLLEGADAYDYSAILQPVLINAVSGTLSSLQLPANVLRINGWNGFLQRTVWEVAGNPLPELTDIAAQLNKRFIFVADEAGLVAARVIAMIVNEAYFALAAGVSTREEIDTAMKLGTNYPYGPFEWADHIGIAHIANLLLTLSQTDIRYEPAALLLQEAGLPAV